MNKDINTYMYKRIITMLCTFASVQFLNKCAYIKIAIQNSIPLALC